MIYLQNDIKNYFYPTFLEGSLSGTGEYLIHIRSNSTNKEFYFTVSAETSNDRYDKIGLTLTGSNYTYINSIPNQSEDQFYYKAYELYSGITSGITSEMLSASTIDILTACTSTNIIEEGKFYTSGSTSLDEIIMSYSGSSNQNYVYYK